jgi:hypothetical protein
MRTVGRMALNRDTTQELARSLGMPAAVFAR